MKWNPLSPLTCLHSQTNQGFSDKLQTRQRTSTTVDELVAKEVYRTTVIGGVVVKTSVVQEKPYTAVEAALKTDLANTMEKTKVLKAGFAVKQGAVVSLPTLWKWSGPHQLCHSTTPDLAKAMLSIFSPVYMCGRTYICMYMHLCCSIPVHTHLPVHTY